MVGESVEIASMKVSEEDIINIKGGLVGMPELTRFVLMELSDKSPFHWLQSLDNGKIGFVVSDPTVFSDKYAITLDKRIQEVLEIEKSDELAVMVVVTVKKGEVTGNLLGPIIVNVTKRIGCQVVLEGSDYSPRQKVRPRETQSAQAQAKVEVTV